MAVIDEASHPELDAMAFDGELGSWVNVAHADRAEGLSQASGTVALAFVASSPGQGWQTLFSKDARGYEDGLQPSAAGALPMAAFYRDFLEAFDGGPAQAPQVR